MTETPYSDSQPPVVPERSTDFRPLLGCGLGFIVFMAIAVILGQMGSAGSAAGLSLMGMVSLDVPVTGSLGTSGIQRWNYDGTANSTVAVSLDGSFDTYLTILDGDLQVLARDDDSGPGRNSFICAVTLPYEGRYYIDVSGYSADEGGSYTLSIEAAAAPPEILREIDAGELVSASIASCQGDWYSFRGAAGDSVTITMVIPDGDAVLAVYDSDRRILDSNDDYDRDADGNLRSYDAQITEYLLSYTGTYLIQARDYYRSVDVGYTLIMERNE